MINKIKIKSSQTKLLILKIKKKFVTDGNSIALIGDKYRI